MIKTKAFSMLLFLLISATANAQIFSNDRWKTHNIVTLKKSELFVEANLGINITPNKRTADFAYMAFGYGRPSATNPWRKFLPAATMPSGMTNDEMRQYIIDSTSRLHAFKLGAGWNHYFNHNIGFYAQAGWATIADFSTEAAEGATDEVQTETKETFIYNTVPVELGVTACAWKRLTAQLGFTYMWKEIPLITFGVGFTF